VGEDALLHARRAADPGLEAEAFRLVASLKLHGDVTWDGVLEHADEMDAAGLDTSLQRAWAATMTGRFDDARRYMDDFVRGELELGRAMNVLMHGPSRGRIELLAGEADRAEALLRDSWVELGKLGERGYRSTIGGDLGELLARRGALEEAEGVLDEAMGISSPDDWVTVAGVTMSRAFVAAGHGDFDLACALAGEAAALADGREYLTLQQEYGFRHAEILLLAGRAVEARAALERTRAVGDRKGSKVLVDQVDRLLAGLEA